MIALPGSPTTSLIEFSDIVTHNLSYLFILLSLPLSVSLSAPLHLCFNCRNPGYGLADCPEIKSYLAKIDPALDVCESPYAKSFICGKTGYMSRSCPDNPKGLHQGCCLVCGSVEHIQKDCPEHQAASKQVTLGWLFNNMSTDHEEVHVPVKKLPPKQAKVVIF
uniref:CCHC-type domain-containing protein n=1 Tax=Oncorhynchus mykiss TaxID=8022 RepID=A0A8C7V2Y6_ONCMY